MSSNLPFDKETLETLAIDVFRNLTLVSLLFFGIDLLVLPGYVDFYIGRERLLYLLFISTYIHVFLYVRKLERTDTIRFKRSNKLISYTFYALMTSAIFCYLPYLVSSSAAVPIVTATLALGLTTFYLRRSEKTFSYTLHPKLTWRSYVIDHETIYRYISLLFYGMLLLAILNMIVHWYPLASVGLQVTKVTIAIGILSIYFNREQVRHHLQIIQELNRNYSRFKIIDTFAAYLNREWLTPLTQCIRNFDRNDLRHERINSIFSHTFLGLILVLAIQSSALLLLPETLKTPITLATLILGAATYYLKRTVPISSLLHKGDHENKHEFRYRWINDAIPYAFYLLLILTLLSHIPWPLDDLKTEIMVAAIIFGIFTFCLNRERVEAEIKLEKNREERAERKREEEFDRKFTFLTGLNLDYAISENWKEGNYGNLVFRVLIAPFVWITRLLYNSVRWMYKEEGWYSAGLILIVGIYFFVQFSMFQYPGNHPDEYHHIIAAKSLVETGEFPILNTYLEDKGYVRGAPISYLIAFFFSIFGMSLFVAKLVPISLGFINLLLLSETSKSIISNKKIRFVLLLTFVLSSWLVFNHFYIRHYVFLECMLLFLAFLISKLNDTISYQKSNGLIYVFIVVFINICNYFLMNDVTKYIIPIATAFGFIYLFLFESHKCKIKQRKLQKIFDFDSGEKILFLLILCIVGLLLISNFVNLTSLMDALLTGTTNTASEHFNFNNFFFGIYLFFTLFFIIGMIGNIMFNDNNKIIYFLIVPLLLLHYISSESAQVMRLMIYLLPLFYLLSFYGLEKVMNSFQNKKIIAILLIFFLITTVSILQDDKDRIFSKGYPVFPSEIGYHEYEPMYNYLKNNLSEYVIINTEYNIQKEKFFGVETDYKLDFKNVFDQHYTHYYDENREVYRQVYTNTPVIKDRDEYNSIISNEKVCIILSDHANHFLENSDIAEIKNNFREEARFIGFTIYCKD
ncbi:glycosyltransferase family 39 protein [Methanococcoides sp. NM1]|uniref:ArnT family glycosyltransferase n=1 Tax=Methanococcoides sp. NM1 TaxID=1201013 RepID=UPI0010840CB9|nr:hypothetical protein [Methanococcoides sp. NM1]